MSCCGGKYCEQVSSLYTCGIRVETYFACHQTSVYEFMIELPCINTVKSKMRGTVNQAFPAFMYAPYTETNGG